MDPSKLNFLAIVVATFASFAIGSVWYSPILFGRSWMKENNFTDDDLKNSNMLKLYAFTFILAFIMALNLAFFLGEGSGIVWGLIAGGLVGVGWISTAIGIVYLFEGKSLKLFLINSGYQSVTLIVMEGIIGAWQ